LPIVGVALRPSVAATTSTFSYRFGRFELQPAERRLLSASEPVAVGPRAFDLLVTLVERGGSLVTKDELLDRVWPGVIVEDNALQAQISILRKVLGPNAIATVSRSGYRFALELTSVAGQTSSARIPSYGASTPRHNLPQSLTSFIGREKEIAELEQLLGTTRLLTLTGSGGCGKTRLALWVAAHQLQTYPDGVWLAELAALADPGLIPQAVAGVFGLKEEAGKTLTQSVGDRLASCKALLLLDNAEHLLEACARFIDEVLRRCAQVTILVTTRERLGLAGELTYRVPSLAVPDPMHAITPEELLTCDSARLFIDRARLHQPHFAPTARNAAALASVCWRLDGIPLAIELAAPRLRSMTVEEVNRRLDQRFGLLTGGSRTALPRQRTLRSLIDWSYDLLRTPEQALLDRLSVFSGGWTIEAAEAVCSGDGFEADDTLELLTSLVDKNLALAEAQEEATRYFLLETVRQYARDRLGEQQHPAQWQDGHLAYFLALVEVAEPGLRGAEQRAWLERLEIEHDNLRAALVWSSASETGAESGLRIAGALFPFWARRSYLGEGRSWLTRLLAATSGAPIGEARAKALNGAGVLARYQGDSRAARTFMEESLAIRRALGNRRGTAVTLINLAALDGDQVGADYPGAKVLYEESLAISRELDDRWSIAMLLNRLAEDAYNRQDFARARLLDEESLAIRRELGDAFGIAVSLGGLGEADLLQGDVASADARFKECVNILMDLGDLDSASQVLYGFASVAFAVMSPRRSARLWSAADRLLGRSGYKLGPERHRRRDRLIVDIRNAFGDDRAFDLACAEGRAMTIEQAVQYALDADDQWPPFS
jgi:predicted ATPase/DNA-binding winged helix-turn-helix (wHTH) protein